MKRKICLFIGSYRPVVSRRDSGEELIKALLPQGLNLTTVYLRPDDPLRKKKYKNCAIKTIPQIMRQPRKHIVKSFKENEFTADWKSWMDDFRLENYDLGIVYFGSWIPPELFNTPKYGFINFHPGPLPSLRGFEAETWAILSDMRYFYGTVHRVSENYDEGEIIWRTQKVRIRQKETPTSILQRVCYAGIKNIHKVTQQFLAGRLNTISQKAEDGILASVKFVSSYAKVDWAKDSLNILNRKNRAFNGQYISVSLTLNHKGQERIIRDLHVIPGEQEGGLGKYLGKYPNPGHFQGKDMFQALDGIVIFDFLPLGSTKPLRAAVFAEYNDKTYS